MYLVPVMSLVTAIARSLPVPSVLTALSIEPSRLSTKLVTSGANAGVLSVM